MSGPGGGHSAPVPGRSGRGRSLAIRLLVTAGALVVWFWTQSLIGGRELPGAGIGDGLHTLTAPLNAYLHAHPAAANALLILTPAL